MMVNALGSNETLQQPYVTNMEGSFQPTGQMCTTPSL